MMKPYIDDKSDFDLCYVKNLMGFQFQYQFQYVEDYCLVYYCENGEAAEWSIVAEACVCFENTMWDDAKAQLKEYDSLFNGTLNTNSTKNDVTVLRR